MFYKLVIIAKNTFIEALRQPIDAVIISLSLLMFIMSPSLTMYTMDEDIKLLREIGLSTLFLAGLFISIFTSAGAITEEIETKTITTVLSKPVSRSVFVIGKFLGVACAVGLAHYICTIALLMSVRHGVLETASDTHDWPVITAATISLLVALIITAFLNYTYDWNFAATASVFVAGFATLSMVFLYFIDKEWQFNPENNNLHAFDLYASILLFLAVLILTSLAVMFSTRFNIVITLTLCVGAFLMGLISDWVFGRFAESHVWAKIGRAIAPNLQVFWISDAIYEGSNIPIGYIFLAGSYAILYSAAILFFAIALFQRRQVG